MVVRIRCPKQCVLIGKIKRKVKLWIDDVHLSVRLSTYCQWFPLCYDKWYYKNNFLQYNTTSNSKSLPNLCLKRHKTTDMRFKTVIPSLLRIAKKYRGWQYNFKFWKSALSQKLGGKYALDSKIICSSDAWFHLYSLSQAVRHGKNAKITQNEKYTCLWNTMPPATIKSKKLILANTM